MFFLPLSALTLPCPNGKGILYKGNSLEEVIQECGEPLHKNTRIKTLHILEQWTYYIKHSYDPGYSVLVLSFTDGITTKIHIQDYFWTPVCRPVMIRFGAATTVQTGCINFYDPMFTDLCGSIFQIGATIQTVEAMCGYPAVQTKNVYTIDETEFFYGKGIQETIIFQNGKLFDWK